MIILDEANFWFGDSATAYYMSSSGKWVLEDQYNHPDDSGMSVSDNLHPVIGGGGEQNLYNAVVWQPTPNSVSVMWSRYMSTTDSVTDYLISCMLTLDSVRA